ncbi:uncharacterized protein OCT59_021665 [Rhizophagus irregularis]|uniref:BTB domain-containing protein n=1 Tax=Rhizophagus irregularis (strain DAOM 181602 / DAOM 197198 / MUCL 43194) TaxID=747089 RepID=U9U3R5_RHIID|nr:hypothetical protein GLOIN_2v1687000 [Rhizophagus irregularis DAOM 181602=DAOM 197198]POG63416.1 hypothetical protein GLOIN_2v1687000 [Rhizophagus irregularis DAOM 181602=DAOM 197198]UZO28122.1 hypothetical protein OCT59_021665 [Rhizophagus irregularis]GBC16195.1 hypothetical protein GLOIN_2v1687000 [Rhizophagus irregularis DAOM 181602=DAOM 197198]|eukprot:XP_025170282.1 hypothetical protein GLOIN_2v1687000 [Rhizophagus irregularis DAOM 181602=DAOM 197198]
MPPKHQIYIDRAEFVRSLFNDSTTANILLRVDNFHIYAHTSILYCVSGFFKKIFKLFARKIKEDGNNFLFHDYSCNREIAINKLYEYKGQEKVELLYDIIDFQNFIAFLYGYPVETRDQDQLFVLAYLGSSHKFDVPELVNFCDNVLYEVWNKQQWHVILRVSKWLGLKKLRCQVLRYVYNQGELMFQRHAKKDLDEKDWQIMFVLTSGKDPLLNIDNILNGTYNEEFTEDNISKNINNNADINNADINNEDINNDMNDSNDDDMMLIDDENYNDYDQSMEIAIADYEKLYKPPTNDKRNKHVHWGPETFLITDDI